MEALVELPGVGRKTANVVLGHALGVPGLPVDRHVLRVANRIGIAESDDPDRRRSSSCAPRCRRERWTRTSDTLILHGRRICRPKPLCDQCAVRDDCDYYRTVVVARARPRRRAEGAPKPKATPVQRDAFERLVADALASIPRRFRDAMTQHRDRRRGRAVARSCCDEMEIEPPDTLLGLYQGTPLTERRWDYGNTLPDRILLFQGRTSATPRTRTISSSRSPRR